MWGTTGSWTSLKKNNGVYSTDITSAARLLTPAVGPDQFAEITYDQDPGAASWPGVMTRVQGASERQRLSGDRLCRASAALPDR